MPDLDREVIDALHHCVDNGGAGQLEVTLWFDPEHQTYSITFHEGGITHGGAEAPTLELAIVASAYCSEGDSVLVDRRGQALCLECRGGKCPECHGTGRDTCPPHCWPRDGLSAFADQEVRHA